MIASKDSHPANVAQLDKFKQAARNHEADEDDVRWDEKEMAEAKPALEKPE